MNRDTTIFYTKYPYIVCFIFSFVFLVAAVFNYQSAFKVKNYHEVQGEIMNVEAREKLWHQRYITEYSYDVVWYEDGKQYKRHFKGQTDKVEEGEKRIWVSKDYKKVALHNGDQIGNEVPGDILVSVISAALGILVYYIRKKKRL